MRGHWVSQTRKLNRHYQSTKREVPEGDFIVYTHNMRYSYEFQDVHQIQGQTAYSFNAGNSPRGVWGYISSAGSDTFVYAFDVLQADAGSDHSFTYKASDDDTLELDLKYGLAPDYISPYLGGSAVQYQVSALGGKTRNIVNSMKVTLEVDTTFTIDLLKLETDEYAAAGRTYTKTYKTGDNADLYFPQGFYVTFIDANDDTNYLVDYIAQGITQTSQKSIDRTISLNTASNWTQNTVPTQYKVNIGTPYWINDKTEIELHGYLNDEFVHCCATNATGSTTIKLSLKEV